MGAGRAGRRVGAAGAGRGRRSGCQGRVAAAGSAAGASGGAATERRTRGRRAPNASLLNATYARPDRRCSPAGATGNTSRATTLRTSEERRFWNVGTIRLVVDPRGLTPRLASLEPAGGPGPPSRRQSCRGSPPPSRRARPATPARTAGAARRLQELRGRRRRTLRDVATAGPRCTTGTTRSPGAPRTARRPAYHDRERQLRRIGSGSPSASIVHHRHASRGPSEPTPRA